MKISSVRFGFANNSSSTHSVLIGCKSPAVEPDYEYYGWDWFHLKTREDKARYYAVQLFYSMPHQLNENVRLTIVKDVVGIDLRKDDTGIDHNSIYEFPTDFKGVSPHYGYIKALQKLVVDNPDVSIRGGNDNDDYKEHIRFPSKSKVDVPRRNSRHDAICRQDGNWFTLFNRNTGFKSRVSFNLQADPYTQSRRPELVDLKITDMCNHGCEFCYMSSKPDGKHAKLDDIKNILHSLGEAEVFEVALGGGEPTLHPDFPDILKTARGNNVVPNFATKDMSFARKPKLAEAVRRYAGSFAVSTVDPKEIRKVVKWNEDNDLHGDWNESQEATIQIPMGCYPRKAVEKAVIAAGQGAGITLLGYKNVGRGRRFKPEDYSWIIDFITDGKHGVYLFGADSVFVEQFGDRLKDELHVHHKLMVGSEGKFTCYIDAVNKKIGASSYCPKKDMKPIDMPKNWYIGERIWEHYPFPD